MLHRIEAWLRYVFTALAIAATVAGVLIVVLVGASVTMRHLAHAPFRFTEELVGLLMTTAFFLALPLVTLNADHVRVRILVSAMPARIARLVAIVAALFGIAFAIWFFWLCIPWFEFAYLRNIKTEVGRLLMYPWMAVLPVSMVLTSVAFAVRLSAEADCSDV
ncbi:C4-dicarboxylate ABC transporter [Chromatiales bacterium (ex Bugula neritina AB1)]|nr:C4-dicarboxylate ABC transporter [Chromatiales bacterium (ex Bugula neritina AB1)]